MLYENEYEFKMSLGVKNWILRCDWDNCFRYAYARLVSSTVS